jgi:hypothetical protein
VVNFNSKILGRGSKEFPVRHAFSTMGVYGLSSLVLASEAKVK